MDAERLGWLCFRPLFYETVSEREQVALVGVDDTLAHVVTQRIHHEVCWPVVEGGIGLLLDSIPFQIAARAGVPDAV